MSWQSAHVQAELKLCATQWVLGRAEALRYVRVGPQSYEWVR